jgi:hypothetical protein
MGQWSSGYDAKRNIYENDDDIGVIFGRFFLLFYRTTTASFIVLKSLSVVNNF